MPDVVVGMDVVEIAPALDHPRQRPLIDRRFHAVAGGSRRAS
jgi:arginase family enzyme